MRYPWPVEAPIWARRAECVKLGAQVIDEEVGPMNATAEDADFTSQPKAQERRVNDS